MGRFFSACATVEAVNSVMDTWIHACTELYMSGKSWQAAMKKLHKEN